MTKCSISDCDRPVKAHGFCATHYMRLRRHGNPEVVKRRGPKRDEAIEEMKRLNPAAWSERTYSRFIRALDLLRMVDVGAAWAMKECSRSNGSINVAKLEAMAELIFVKLAQEKGERKDWRRGE